VSSPSVEPPSMLTLIMSTTTVLIFNSNSPFPLADVLGFVLGHKWASDQSLVRSIIGRLSGSSPFPRAAQYPGGDRGPAPGAAGREFLLQLPDPFMLTQRAGPQPTRTPNVRCRNDPDPAPRRRRGQGVLAELAGVLIFTQRAQSSSEIPCRPHGIGWSWSSIPLASIMFTTESRSASTLDLTGAVRGGPRCRVGCRFLAEAKLMPWSMGARRGRGTTLNASTVMPFVPSSGDHVAARYGDLDWFLMSRQRGSKH
jgi:hypothetical protein